MGPESLVWRITVGVSDQIREYESCWIVIDREDQRVHIWSNPKEQAPTTTAPLASTLIEWTKRQRADASPPPEKAYTPGAFILDSR